MEKYKKSCKRNRFKIFKIILNISSKKHEIVTNNSSIRTYINKMENIIAFQMKQDIISKLQCLKTMKLLGSIRIKISRDGNGENVSHLEITEVVLVNCYIASDYYQHDSNR